MPAETLHLRVSTPDDLTALDALYARAYPALLKRDYPPSVIVTAIPLIARANPQLAGCGTFYVVETPGGALVGAGGWTRPSPLGGGADSGVAHVRHVVCDPAHVRRGVGRRIMTHVCSEAAQAGVRRLDCQRTRTAVPFYTALGFVRRGDLTVPLAPGISLPAVAMTRMLSSP
ncbi:N-acetyltransferase [Rhodobacteraceae bacterium CCMM004]|nr:N-acetyltransferase [Rhodobacteraceae bacterium CCMM004]